MGSSLEKVSEKDRYEEDEGKTDLQIEEISLTKKADAMFAENYAFVNVRIFNMNFYSRPYFL